ncbi:polyadenylate-binding protein-like [Xenia sp. Carnegie-2017]|uniref:polyadenylate-binding protein-like n=1 Tax=Xenia sp. Carnegie-2017 TaxID=2897299 RepID=UPI001F04A6C6|nr:polyadenylate-binding protein-like [Xenia sp. Carnegie-2017]
MGSEVSSEQNSQEEDSSIALYNKVCTFQRENAEKITGMLLELPQEELKTLLCDDSKLMAKIYEAIKALDNESKDKQRKLIGDVMYCEVEKAYNDHEIAGKITGMLLEMELENLEQLLLDKKALLVKIHEAYAVLKTYNDANNSEKEASSEVSLEELGEKLFERILEWYVEEDTAAKLTGMLLEMNNDDIHQLIKDNDFLKLKTKEAYDVLSLGK